jgi:hypothetical protein
VTGAERYFQKRLEDDEYRQVYEKTWKWLTQSDERYSLPSNRSQEWSPDGKMGTC